MFLYIRGSRGLEGGKKNLKRIFFKATVFRIWLTSQPPLVTDWVSGSYLSLCLPVSIFPVSSCHGNGSLIWHDSASLLFFLSCTQPGVSGCSDRDEESGWGQRHLTLPPSVPHIWLVWHRVAAAETKLQTDSGKIRCLCRFDSSPPSCSLDYQGFKLKTSP